MADSDGEYVGSDDDAALGVNGAGPSGRSKDRNLAARPKERAQAKWEAAAASNWELQEGVDGGIEGVLGGLEEAGKRQRYSLRS
jgi:transcription initiation factor TFIIH subunit 2